MIDPTRLWTIVAAVAVGTFAFRLSFLAIVGRVDAVPPGAERALQFVAPAVLAAVLLPSLVVADGSVAVVGNVRLLAGLVGAVVAWRTESIVWTMVAGIGALVLLQQLL